jgi:glycosyltransferase involved in cell wall biosynthesis
MTFVEAAAFGVPAITARIHHDEAFGRHGVTGYLLETPVFAHSDEWGTRWRDLDEWLIDVARRRERKEFRPLVEDAVDRIESMISGDVDHLAMGHAARELHREEFSLEARNQNLRRLYEPRLLAATGRSRTGPTARAVPIIT